MPSCAVQPPRFSLFKSLLLLQDKAKSIEATQA